MTLIRGDAIAIPLRDESVDLVVTSPPYFALRSYVDGGEHYDGQIGSEPTPQDFLEALWAVTRECRRVLKPSGSMWVNLGDKYVAGTSAKRPATSPAREAGLASGQAWHETDRRLSEAEAGARTKSLMGLPWRYAIGCIDNLDLILRAEVIWCLSGGARVYAEIDGKPRPVMLRDLVRAYKPENVRLWNGEKWTQVLGWNKSNDTDGALEFELRSGERIGCTPGHRWPTRRGLLRADEVQVGDVIDSCPLPGVDEQSAVGRDLGWFVGLYIAEGSRSGQTIQFAGHVKESARLAALERLAKLYDGSCRAYADGNKATITVSGAILRGVLDRYVSPGTARTKRLTMHAWGRGNDFLLGVIEGYLSGDGHYDEANDRWRLGFTDNDEWAADLRTLAARLGATLTLKRATVAGFGRSWPAWRGEWRAAFRSSELARPRAEVVAIRRSRARQFFDVGVADEPHLFALASGVLTHNSKPNGLPESVTDRVRRSHEQWFHFTKEPRYFAAVDEVREPHDGKSQEHFAKYGEASKCYSNSYDGDDGVRGDSTVGYKPAHPLGRLPGSVWTDEQPSVLARLRDMHSERDGDGFCDCCLQNWPCETRRVLDGSATSPAPGSVWTIPSEPLKVPDWLGVDHFAAFPQEWPRRIILGWSPSGICVECGQGRRPVVEKEGARSVARAHRHIPGYRDPAGDGVRDMSYAITGYSCDCDQPTAPTRPAVVLDPFGGTGTVSMVARALGRYPVHIDLSADYLRLARWRIYESGHAVKSQDRTWREQARLL